MKSYLLGMSRDRAVREQELDPPGPPRKAAPPPPPAEAVRVRAYHLWQAAGTPPGDGVGFWLAAEKELTGN